MALYKEVLILKIYFLLTQMKIRLKAYFS